MPQKIERYLIKVVRALGGINKVGCNHRIKGDSGKPDPVPFKYDPVILYILAYFFMAGFSKTLLSLRSASFRSGCLGTPSYLWARGM